MKVSKIVCIRDCKCCDCFKHLERGVHERIAIKSIKKDMVLCLDCYKELKEQINNL